MSGNVRLRQAVRTSALIVSLGIGAGVTLGQAAPATAPASAGRAVPAMEIRVSQQLEVLEGDEWSPATVVALEGRRVMVRYADGTDEWVGRERLRISAGGPPTVAGSPDAARPAPALAPPTPAAAGAVPVAVAVPKPATRAAIKEAYVVGQAVEVWEMHAWKPATVRNRDGDLYLIARDAKEKQNFWRWVDLCMVRSPGAAKVDPPIQFAQGQLVGGMTVLAAKAEAKKRFADAGQGSVEGEKDSPAQRRGRARP